MSRNMRWGLVVIALLTLIFMLIQIANKEQLAKKTQAELIQLETQAVHYAHLKKRWAQKKEVHNLLRRLAAIKPFDQQLNQKQKITIGYKQLDAALLDRISYTLFGSDVMIKSVVIEKKQNRVDLIVEMQP